MKEFFSHPEMITPAPEKPNALKSEHLNEGIKPIMASIIERKQFNKEHADVNAYTVDFYEKSENLDSKQYKNAGSNSYVISAIDSTDKVSHDFYNCTGLAVTGRSKASGEDISFLSHQNPHFFLYADKKEVFFADLHERLLSMQDACEAGTVDAVIFGGNYVNLKERKLAQFKKLIRLHKNPVANYKHPYKDYKDSIALLSREIENAFGFEPVVISGPKEVGDRDTVAYVTKERHLYIVRPEVIGRASTESFLPSDYEEQEQKWLEPRVN